MKDKLLKRLKEINERGLLYREATAGVVDLEARTVELSFSSEMECDRWFGVEILGHDSGEVRLDRMNDNAAVLWMHDWRDQRGVVVPGSARIDKDKKGRCVARFSKSEDGEKLLQDIADGIVTKVSVGYMVHGLKLMEERENIDVYRVTDWEPYEASLVSIPMDTTVGVGRVAEIPQVERSNIEGQNSNRAQNSPAADTINFSRTEKTMPNKTNEAIVTAGEAAAPATNHARTIAEMGRQYGQNELATQFIAEGKSADDFQRALLHDFSSRQAKSKPLDEQVADANIGMTDKEVRSYSLMRVIRALANPNDKNAQRAAAFEIECSLTAQQRYGKEAKGILIPTDVLASSRAFNAGGAANSPTGATSGSNLVATELLAGSFIEMLRKRTTIMSLGTTLAGLVGNVDIPKQTGGATAYWVGEGVDATEGTPTIGQLSLTPKTVAAYTDITRRLAMQATPDAERIVVNDLRKAMSLAIDYAGFYGTGADNQPKGIKNYTGINAQDFAAISPTYTELVGMESLIAADNADVDSMAYVLNAAMRGHCKTTTKFGSGTEATIWEPGNTVNGYRTEVTNQVANGDAFFGNFADLVVALWGGLDLTLDPFSLSKSGGLRVVVFQDVDFVLRRVESMCYGVKPA